MPLSPHRCSGNSLLLGASLTALVACGARLWPTVTAPIPASARTTVLCAATQARSLGYSTLKVDSTATHFEAVRGDSTSGSHNPPEIERADALEVQVRPAAGDTTKSSLTVEARSVSRQMTRRGLTDVGLYATPQVKQDAAAVIKSCGGA